jgi:hypothetical protein
MQQTVAAAKIYWLHPASNQFFIPLIVVSTNRPRLQRGRIKFAFVTQQTLFHFMIALIHKAA